MFFRIEIRRRRFIKSISSVFLGVLTGRFWKADISLAKTERVASPGISDVGQDRDEGNSRKHGGDELYRSICASSGL